jgi:2-oxoglutarate ferredoxin oxidoreductase subunit alpha
VAELRDFGALVYESQPVTVPPTGHVLGHLLPGQIPYGCAMREISEKATGANRSRNIVAIGYVAGLFGLPKDSFHAVITKQFAKRGAKVAEVNCAGFDAGYAAGAASFKLDDAAFRGATPAADGTVTMMNGNAAVARGCLDAGINSFFGYPITPATTIMERLATDLPKQGGRLVQTEDEISAISATIGAGWAGNRCATSTSGPGLSLMQEMLGLGVMAEVPSVVFVSQRGGPSTGMPTKTEQSDLNCAIFGGHGDAPRIVIAPTNVDGCYRCAGKAFEMAEAYQTPVIVLLDLYLSNRYETVCLGGRPPFELDSNNAPKKQDLGPGYKRFALTDEQISPRAIPGDAGGMHVVTGLEHNELGRPADTAEIHTAMSRKRHDKLQRALSHPDFTIAKRFGDPGLVEVGLLAWGSSFGECLEAMLLAQKEGISCAAMKVVMLSPLPELQIAEFIDSCSHVLVPELNYHGQFAHLVQGTLGCKLNRLNSVSGAPMKVNDILDEMRRLAAMPARPMAAE